MKRLLLATALCIPWFNAYAQGGMGPGPGTVHSAGSSYTGQGDVLSSSPLFWGGTIGYSAAVAATGTQKAVNIRRASDNIQCDVLIATNGALGLTTATCNSSTQGGLTPLQFAGTDATGTGAIATNTMTFTGGHVGDTVSCGTCLPGTYIVSGSSPTWAVNFTQTVASTTITLTWANYVTKLYNQSGGAAGDQAQATALNQPQLMPSYGPTTSCYSLYFYAPNSQFLSGSLPLTAQGTGATITTTALDLVLGSFRIMVEGNGGGGPWALYDDSSANKITLNGGTVFNSTFTPTTNWRALQGILAGASSIVTLDGTDSTGNAGSSNSGTTLFIGEDSSAADYWYGPIMQVGVWAATANRTTMNTNMHGACGGW